MSRKAAFAAACIGYTAWSVDGGAGELAIRLSATLIGIWILRSPPPPPRNVFNQRALAVSSSTSSILPGRRPDRRAVRCGELAFGYTAPTQRTDRATHITIL